MRCYNCHGKVEDLANHCPFCGCNREAASGSSDNRKAHELIDKSYAIADYILPFAVMVPVCIFAAIMTAIFGDNPDKLLFGFCLVVGAAALGICIYGIVYQRKHSTRLHRPSTKIAAGRVVDCRSPHRGLDLIIVEFEVNGKTYRHVSKNRNNDPIESGRKIDIAYNYHNPYDNFVAKDYRGLIMIISTLIVIAVFGGLGIFISSRIGIGPLLKA